MALTHVWKTGRKGCSVPLGTKRNYKVVEEKLLDFVWYINKLVPSGTEATVLLNVYPVLKFVSKFDFNIRQHSTVDRRAYYNATQNVFVV